MRDDFSCSPWLIRLCDGLPMGPLGIGLSVAAAFYGVNTALSWLFVENPWYFSQARIDVAVSCQVGYLVGVAYYGRREAARDFYALRPALDCDDGEFEGLLSRLRRIDRTTYLGGGIGLGIGLCIPNLGGYWADAIPPFGSALLTLHMGRMAVVAALVGQAIAVEFFEGSLFALAVRRHARIDLLDLGQVAPFTRRALRSVLVLMLFSAILSLLIFVTPTPSLALFWAGWLALLAALAFLLPLLPLRRCIDEVKQTELGRVRAAIRETSSARLSGDADWSPPDSRLADLIVYESRIESVNSWAFNASTVIRFGLYVSVGIGSWLGAALVERGLGIMLDR